MFARRPALLGLGFVFALTWTALAPLVARADVRQVEVGASPIVRIVVGRGTVNVRTWDKPGIQVDGPTDVLIRQFSVTASDAQSTIPILAGRVEGPDGPVDLPPESFAVSTLPPGPRPVVAVRGKQANVTVTVPKNASLVTVQLGGGRINMQDYRGGTFVARVRGGSVHLDNVGGDGFVQVMHGPVIARNSSFDRIRVRTGLGNAVFDGCHAKQIQVSSVSGSIVYDGGTFEPGLARFETQNGNVAVGVAGPSELNGHSATGRTYASFDHGTVSAGGQHAVVGTGGPLVNASSGTGNVYLYDGSLRARKASPEWDAPRETLNHAGQTPHAPPPAAPPPPGVEQGDPPHGHGHGRGRGRHPHPMPSP